MTRLSISVCPPRFVQSACALLAALACAGVLQAQDTNAPKPVTADLPAVAQYPKSDDLFPGKGPAQKGDWFVKTWTQRRAQFWQTREQDRHAVVFLGDSITQGWKSLAADFPGLKTANRGISGDTTRGILYRLKEDVLDLEPEAVVLLIGTNDIGIGATPEEVAENMRTIVAALEKAYPKMPVIVCKVMPSSETRQRPADKIQALNALVDEIVKSDSLLHRCDTWSIYADANGNAKKEEFPDLLHPNQAGYAAWTAALKPIFARLNLGAKKAE
jgi:lysophospholipase L1-like esterase